MTSSLRSRIIPPVIISGLFIALWYVVSTALLPTHKQFLLPRPDVVVTDAFFVWSDGNQRGMKTILRSLWNTTFIAVVGLAITSVIGIGVALTMSLSRWAERAAWPYLVAIQAAPIIALTPLIRALIDSYATQRLLVVVLIAFFPITSATLFGLTSVPRSQHDFFTVHHANRYVRLKKLQIPHAVPSMFLGLRTSAGLAVIGAVVGDFYFRGGGKVGIGAQIDLYRAQLWGPELIAAVIMASLLGIFLFLLFTWFGNKATSKWHQPTTR